MELSEILTHLGEDRSQYFNAIAPPVIQTSNFAFPTISSFRNAFLNEVDSHLYTRGNNPTVEILRKKLAQLEGTEDAIVVGSGASAMSLAVIANVSAGDHIICVASPYSWTKTLLTTFLPRFNVRHTFVEGTSIEAIEAAIQKNTKVLILESPNSVLFDLQDLEACGQLAKKHQLVSIIDNSYASPLHQHPASFGIDIITHTGTKYLNGHSDVVCGVICGKREMIKKIFELEFLMLGTLLSPHDAALVIRGLRTLELRLKRSQQSAEKIIAFLETHPKVERILYPLSPSFPQYELAKRQMTGAGGLFSIFLKANEPAQIIRFFDRLERFLLAVSWGGYESLIMPWVAFHEVPGKENAAIPWNLCRLYIGLEDPDYLIADLEQALEEI